MSELTSVLTDAATLRGKIHQKVTGALTTVFPLDLKGRTLEVKDIKVHDRTYSSDEQKKALLSGGSLQNAVKGTLVLKGADGRVIDEAKDFTLVHVPYMTDRHTIIADGNEYQFANQIRRKPGVYTQRSENGELHTAFNLGKGKNFDISLNPAKGTFHLQYGTSNIPLYGALRGMGVTHDEIAKHLGEGVARENEKEHGKHAESAVRKLYQKLEHPALYNPKLPHAGMVEAVKKRYGMTTLDPDVTEHTLGKPHATVTPVAMLDAAKKLLAVHNGKTALDDTDSLAFKTFHAADDFLAERIKLTARAWAPKVRMVFTGKSKIREALRPAPFSDSIRKFVTTSTLTAVPSGINPLELMDHAVKVTSLGEGGIGSDRAIPLDARMTHATHFGALDPIRTPESGHAGVDIRATIAAHRDDRGNLYSTVKDVKTGKQVFIKAGDLTKHVIAFPQQNLKGDVQAFVNGEVKSVPGSKVTHEMLHVSHQYSPATSLIPMIHNIQGNRAIMGSKMGTQALPLLEREVPYVQVKSHLPGEVSFESIYGHMTVPTSPVHGTVEKIENGYIYIRPHGEKKAEDRPPQHILITGHSGAGKSTFAKSLAKQTGLPLHQFDEVPGMAEAMLGSDHAKVHQLQRAAVADGLKNLTTPHIMEGTALLSSPELMQGHRVILMDAPREALLKARLERMVQQALNRGRPADPERRHAKGVALYDHYEPMVAAFRKMPGVEVRAPGYVPTAKEASELVRGVRAKEAEDRPVIEQKKLGPHTFNIEIKKDVGHKAEGQTKAKGTSEDYGHLPGYVGPDSDSLDFFVGNRHDGLIYAYDKQKRLNAKGELDPKAPWKVTDIKFVVGHSPAEAEEFHRNTVKFDSPTVRFANRRFFKDWNHLQRHIDEHHKAEKTSAAKDEKGLIKVPFETNFPFPSKTYLHHDVQVKPGQTVQAGQRLGDSNYTRNGTLALGKNLLVGYMPYHGLNSNDAVVISEGCAQKLTSEHMYREVYPLNSQIELSKNKHKTFYGNKYTPQQYGKLDDSGVIKVGTRVDPKDPLILGLTKAQIQGVDLMLGRISKALTKPYREVTLEWGHGTPGVVVDVVRSASQIAILVKTQERMNVGDKLAGRYGNKGVVAKIVPDHEMIQDEKGRPLDLILTSAGVVSRINPAQIIETAVGKVVEKTKKPILYDNGENKNAVQWAKNLLKEHGIKDKEHVYDPRTKRTIKGPDGNGVLVGRQFIYKLFKSTDTNFSGHGVGPYDVNEQPLKTGGDESAKGIGKMEFDAIVAHNARHFLQEAASIKGQKNDEFWRAVQLGSPLPTPKPSFAFNKFTAMLEGSGVKVDKRGSKFKLLPMTDKDVLARSRGAIENTKTLIAKNLKPETGGLFDPNKTGGPQGTLYSHIDLHESVPHPVFIEPIRRLLGLSQKDFEQRLHDHGGKWFHTELSKIDAQKRISDLRAQMVKAKGPDLDNIVKQIKYLTALEKEKIKPQDAYLISKIPVIPPVFRPILPEKRDPSQLMIADANKLYAHLMDTNNVLKTTALASDLGKHRNLVFKAVGAVFGVNDPEDEKLQKQEVKGFLQNIAGVGTPKGGFFQRKLMRRTQDMSGRGTAVPDGNLGMDDVGIPEQMLWQMYDKMLVARLVRQGYSALTARELVDKKQPVARQALEAETRERPVLINRAPTLHRWSVVAAYPKMVQGKTIRVNPFIEKGMNLDYDGDTLQVHAPIQHGAVEDAKKMTLSQMLLADQQRNKLMAFPQHEAIIGFTLASKATTPTGPARHFRTREDAMAAWRSGKLQLTDAIVIDQEKKAEHDDAVPTGDIAGLSEEEVLSYWPPENVTGHEADPR
jgi:DNA-directed RNA polymerase beta subunit